MAVQADGDILDNNCQVLTGQGIELILPPRKVQVPSSPGFRLITPHLPFAGPGVLHSFSYQA